jgi:hypothetical protein
MLQRPLKPVVYEQVKKQLCSQPLQNRLEAAARRFPWTDLGRDRGYRDPLSWLLTPYGKLQVWD